MMRTLLKVLCYIVLLTSICLLLITLLLNLMLSASALSVKLSVKTMVKRKHVVYDRFNLPDCEPTPEGEEFEILNMIETDPETGYQRLVPTGEKRPIQKCINAAAGIGVLDLDEAFRRYVSGEDVNLIIRKSDAYADVSDFSGDAMDTFIKVRDYVGSNIIIENAAPSESSTGAAVEGGTET